MAENERQQRMVERIQEDERLRGDLEDNAATALIDWASARAAAAAADPDRPDQAVEADVQAVRAAARTAARAGESNPSRVVALAEAALAEASVAHVAAGTPAAAPAPTSAPAAEPAPAATQPAAREVGEAPSDHGLAQPPPAEALPGTPPERPGAVAVVAAHKRRRSRIAGLLRQLRGDRR